MAKLRQPRNQIIPMQPKELPEYGQLVSIMQNETASIITDYIRQWVGMMNTTPEPGQGIFLNWDRVLRSQTYQELAWYELYQEVERDPHVNAIMQSAKLNVAGMKWDVSAHVEAGAKKATARNQAVAEFVKHTLKETGHFPQHLVNLMDAIGKGFSVSEIIWNIGPDGVTIKNILNRPQRRFQYDAVDRSLRLRDITNPYYGTPLPDKKFIVHRCSSQWDNPFGDALDQSIYWMWLFKKTVLKFWMQNLQVAASSVPIVKHPASANKELKAEALSIAEMIRNGAYGRIPDNFEIVFAEAQKGSQNAESYHTFVRMCNDEISKCVNGQTLTTEGSSSSGMGSRALGNVHQITMNQRDVFRAETLASTLNGTIVKWLVDFNFTNVEGYPQFRFDLEDPTDLARESTIVKDLSAAGFEFDVAELSEKFNYTLTKKEPLKLAPANPLEPTKETAPGEPVVPEEPTKEMSEKSMNKRTTRFLKEFVERLEDESIDTEQQLEAQSKELAELKKDFAEANRDNKIIQNVQKLLYKLASKDTVVNVAQPHITVEAPEVHIPQTHVEFKQKEPVINVHVPKQEPPVVNVSVEDGDKEMIMERDGQGWLSRIVSKRSPKKVSVKG